MMDLLSRLRAGEVLVADGAMGTMLFEYGLPPGECPESLNLADPARLEQVARLYVDAGAD
ncbi:MAG: homocysteine S-methyltransferase family protein, partial [Acidobacteriota bacterium]